MRTLARLVGGLFWPIGMAGVASTLPDPSPCSWVANCYLDGGFFRGAAPFFDQRFTWAQGLMLLVGILGPLAMVLGGGWPGRVSWRRRVIRIAGIWFVVSGAVVAATLDLPPEYSNVQRLATVFVGISLWLIVNVFGAQLGRTLLSIRLTKRIRFGLGFLSAGAWLLSMSAVVGWLLHLGGRCSFLMREERALIESSGVDPRACAMTTAGDHVLRAGLVGFFVIIAIALLMRRRDAKAELPELPVAGPQLAAKMEGWA